MITPRLQMILNNVSSGSVADIGTDHAYVPIELAKRGIRVIATDINRGPLSAAERNVRKNGVTVQLLSGSGLSPLQKGDAEEIIIAGMGGELIEKIISCDIEKAYSARLLLQPMSCQAELRKFLLSNGFVIEKEDLAVEGHKVYNLIIAKSGVSSAPAAEIDLHLPPSLYNHPLFPMLLAKKEREFTKQFNGLSRSKNKDFDELKRLNMLLSDIQKLKERNGL
ncbi:MAG: SAM-dependent methyltransferase [Clostridia bacterium]|nr:SAM-dependent methyltransferase [Clostridia bacterium]